MQGDEAYFCMHENGKLRSQIALYVNDFIISGTSSFISFIVPIIQKELKVSKLEKGKFWFTGVNIIKNGDSIEISMEDYAETITAIPHFKTLDPTEKFNEFHQKN